MTDETPTRRRGANEDPSGSAEGRTRAVAYPSDTPPSAKRSSRTVAEALTADLQRYADAVKPLHDSLIRAYVRMSYVQAAMFTDMIAGRTPGTVRSYLTTGGFETGDRS